MKAVVDSKGLKRFKKTGNDDSFSTGGMPMDNLNLSPKNAKDIFRQMTQKTAYASNFGDRPA